MTLFVSVAVVHAHGDRAGKDVFKTGEIIDLSCYMQDPDAAKGKDHAVCARRCIAKGLPAAIKVSGKLYLLLGRGHNPVPPEVAELAGSTARLWGKLIERDGMRAVVVKKIEAAH